MIALAATALFAGCAKEEGPVDPYSVNWGYLEKPSVTSYSALFTAASGWVEPFEELQVISKARCTKPAPKDIKVNVKIDESLVAAYNAEHGTNYALLTGVKLEKDYLTIPKGQYVSNDTIKVVHTTDHQDLLENGTSVYLLPVVIDNFTSSLTKSEQSVAYLTYSATEVLGRVIREYIGTEIDRSGWTVTYDGTDITNIATKNSGYKTIKKGGEIIMDLGTQYDVKTVGVEFDYSISYAGKSFSVAYSEDGTNYTEAGEYFNEYETLKVIVEFFDPLPCRYIKITMGAPLYYSSDLDELRATTAD